METGIYIRVEKQCVDIGDEELDIAILTEYVCQLTEEAKENLIMSLLGRRQEYDEFMER